MKNIVISILVILVIVGIAIFRTLDTNSTNRNQNNNISGGITDNNNTNSESANITNSNNDNCIITLFGNKYDVTTLIKIHPGGNIFECGSDMTNTFIQQHGNDLKRVEKYLVK